MLKLEVWAEYHWKLSPPQDLEVYLDEELVENIDGSRDYN